MARTNDEVTVRLAHLSEASATVAGHLRHVTVQVGGGGSGIIWQPDGVIITNAHVARGSRATVGLADGRRLEAEVVARDARVDLARLAVAADDLPAAAIGDANALRVGELVFAVGNPLGSRGGLDLSPEVVVRGGTVAVEAV